jgi:acyl-coenzyme A synthetase/AMP-(fatty) acid ligase
MEVNIMKNGLKIEAILSMILNVVLGALVFAWLSANASATLATIAGLAVIAIGAVSSFAFPKFVSKAD